MIDHSIAPFKRRAAVRARSSCHVHDREPAVSTLKATLRRRTSRSGFPGFMPRSIPEVSSHCVHKQSLISPSSSLHTCALSTSGLRSNPSPMLVLMKGPSSRAAAIDEHAAPNISLVQAPPPPASPAHVKTGECSEIGLVVSVGADAGCWESAGAGAPMADLSGFVSGQISQVQSRQWVAMCRPLSPRHRSHYGARATRPQSVDAHAGRGPGRSPFTTHGSRTNQAGAALESENAETGGRSNVLRPPVALTLSLRIRVPWRSGRGKGSGQP